MEKILKKEVLIRKLKEHFSKHPKSKSVILNFSMNENKTVWKVQKEGNKYHIIEVNTSKGRFIFEDEEIPSNSVPTKIVGPGNWDPNDPNSQFQKYAKQYGPKWAMAAMPDDQLKKYFGIPKSALANVGSKPDVARAAGMKPYKGTTDSEANKQKGTKPPTQEGKLYEVSVDFTNASKTFMDAMSNLGDHNKLSQALQKINSMIAKITDPVEKKQLGSMLGALTGAVDASTKGAGKITVSQSPTMTQQPASMGAINASRTINGKVLREDDNDLKKKDQSLNSQLPDKTSLETNGETQDSQIEELPRDKTQEEFVFSKSLKGQTIRNADLQLKADGAILTLDLVNVSNPAELSWDNSGKIVYKFQDRPVLIRKQ